MGLVAGGWRADLGPVVIGACVAALLVAGGVPRLMAALAALKGEPALALVQSGMQPTAGGIERIVDGRLSAINWAPNARAQIEIGAVLLAMAGPLDGGSAKSRRLLEGAVARLGAGLAQAPADAQAWHLLATALLALGRPDEATHALRMSFLADPHTVQFSNARTLLGVRLWDRSDQYLRAYVLREMRTLFQLHPEDSARIALRAGILPFLRESLAGDPQDAQALEIILEDYWAAVAG